MDEKKLASAIETRGKIVALGGGLAARAALLAAAHDALGALKSFEAVMVEHEGAKVGEDLARPICFLRGVVGSSIATIEGRLLPVERTQEVVLRAMLRAYEAAALETRMTWLALPDGAAKSDAKDAMKRVEIRAVDVRAVTARLIAMPDSEHLIEHPTVRADYEARLRGDRPLDAPPMEVQ